MANLRSLVAASIVVATMVGAVGDADARRRPRKAKKFQANKTFGLGLMVGAPTAISGKYFYASDRAFDFGVGTVRYWRGRSGLHVHADHLWHPVSLVSNPSFEMPLYLGIGFRLFDYDYDRNNDNYDATAVGLRVPFGIAFDLSNVPMDIFVEVALIADVVVNSNYANDDDFDGDLHGAIGARYYFE